MPIPNLLHPVPIRVEQIQRGAVEVDPDYDEEYEVIARAAVVVLPGLVKWGYSDHFRANDTGPQEGEDGYVLFRLVDLRAQGLVSIYRGDKFIQLGGNPNAIGTDVYVVRLRFEGHYPDQNGPTLLKAFFSDRQPVKGSGAGVLS
jgi:hypothetical protein